MNNYVKIYKNVVDDYFCKRIIDKFESNSQQHETQKDNSMSFTQINIMDSRWNNWKQIPNLAKIVVFPRKDHSYNSVVTKKLNKKNFMYINTKKINISSSLIRKFW